MRSDRAIQVQLGPVLTGARAGAYKLPAEVIATAERAETIGVLARQAALDSSSAPKLDALEAELAEALATTGDPAALDAQIAAGLQEIRRRQVEQEVAASRARALRMAAERAADQLAGEIIDRAEAIVVESLRPALAEVIEEAGKLAPALKGAQTAAEVIAAGEQARRAWLELEKAGQRYKAIRAAFGGLWNATFRHATEDASGFFLTFRNAGQLRAPQGSETPPWPTELAAFMSWLVSGVPQPWLPLPGDQDRALRLERERQRGKVGAGAS